MFERLMKILDWVAIPFGCSAIVSTLFFPSLRAELWSFEVAGLFGLLYIAYGAYLFLFRRAKFDWRLHNGRFLCKVICVVLLTPFILAVVIKYTDRGNPINSHEMFIEEQVHGDDSAVFDKIKKGYKREQHSPSLLWSVYYHFIDPGNQHMAASQRGRNWATMIAILGVFLLNGLLVSSIVGWIDRRKERWLKGEVRYNWFFRHTPHYVVIGGNDMVASLVKQIFATNKGTLSCFQLPYVLVQTSRDVESFRRELFSIFTREEQQHIVIYYGNRILERDIADLHLEKAEELYLLGEETRVDDLESYHDTMNMRCLKLICNYMERFLPANTAKAESKAPKKLLCRVLFEYQTTFSVFQFYELNKREKSIIDFKPFNYYEMWAQGVLVNREISAEAVSSNFANGGYLPLDGPKGISAVEDSYVHLFVVGMSRMGVAMAIEAAHLAHYPNFESKGLRTKITFIDNNAAEEKDLFMGRFKELFALSHWRYGAVESGKLSWSWPPHIPVGNKHLGVDFLDIEWEFINGGIAQMEIQDYILASAKPSAKVTVAICLPESNRSHAAAFYLRKDIYASTSVQQVLVYNRYGGSIIESMLSPEERAPYKNKLRAFGMADRCFNAEYLLQSEAIGKAVDNKYEAISERVKAAMEEVNQQQGAKVYEGKSAVAKFWSNIYSGNTMWSKLRSIKFYEGLRGDTPRWELNNCEIATLADVEHNRWNMEQLLMNMRYLTKEEQREIIDGIRTKEELKSEMAHLNICSNKRLSELKSVDVAARAYDEGLSEMLPDIYKELSVKRS